MRGLATQFLNSSYNNTPVTPRESLNHSTAHGRRLGNHYSIPRTGKVTKFTQCYQSRHHFDAGTSGTFDSIHLPYPDLCQDMCYSLHSTQPSRCPKEPMQAGSRSSWWTSWSIALLMEIRARWDLGLPDVSLAAMSIIVKVSRTYQIALAEDQKLCAWDSMTRMFQQDFRLVRNMYTHQITCQQQEDPISGNYTLYGKFEQVLAIWQSDGTLVHVKQWRRGSELWSCFCATPQL